jgi:hypothetical protein
MAAGAFGLYGSWAFVANRAHGAAAALRAALAQGAGSAMTTLIIGTVSEAVYAALPPRRHRALVATMASASMTALVHVGIHLAARTPEVVRTILPSIVMGYAFAALYAFKIADGRATEKKRHRRRGPSRVHPRGESKKVRRIHVRHERVPELAITP